MLTVCIFSQLVVKVKVLLLQHQGCAQDHQHAAETYFGVSHLPRHSFSVR